MPFALTYLSAAEAEKIACDFIRKAIRQPKDDGSLLTLGRGKERGSAIQMHEPTKP